MKSKNNEVSRVSSANSVKNPYGRRPDGTEKGSGWLGELKLPDGRVATEYSVGVGLDGKETLIPTLVPTLTKEQVGVMVNDVIPNGKKVPDDILRAAVEHAKAQMAKGESVWAPATNAVKSVRQDAKGGDVRSATNGGDNGEETNAEVPVQGTGQEVPAGSPRIVVNPTTFENGKDALCVAFNEAFRIVMEETAFEPRSEPTEAQRKFFSDTAYADDELQLRRTIIARICTFDTSVKDPTDAQLQESIEFLNTVLEIGAPQNEWEQRCVQRILTLLEKARGSSEGKVSPVPGGSSNPEAVGAEDGGTSEIQDDEEEKRRKKEVEEKARQQQPEPQPSETPEEIAYNTEQLKKGAQAYGLKTLGEKDPLGELGVTVKPKEQDEKGNTQQAQVSGPGQAQAVAEEKQQQQAQAPAGVEIGKGFVKIGDKKMTRTEYDYLVKRRQNGNSMSQQQANILDAAKNGVPGRRGPEAQGGFVTGANGQKMTRAEFEFLQKRFDNGNTMSRQQLAIIGKAPSDNGPADRVDSQGYRMYDDNGKKIKTRYRQLFAITGYTDPKEAGMKTRDLRNLTRLRYLGLI